MRIWVVALLLGLACVGSASAQERALEGLEATESGQAYLKSIRFRGVDTDVAYYDPTRPAPEIDPRQAPDPERDGVDVNLSREQGSFLLNAISLAVLLGVAFLFLRYGGQFSVSLRGDTNASRDATSLDPASGILPDVPRDLEAITRIEDRRLALVTLAQSALIRAVAQHGLLLQKSWTARDALRRLPREMDHHDALKDLVGAGERVLFGGRDVPETDFQTYLNRIRPLFAERAA